MIEPEEIIKRVERFHDALRDEGVHVGWGREPRCVTCDEPWPCKASGVGHAD